MHTMEDDSGTVNQSYFWAWDNEKGWNWTTYFSFFNDFNRPNPDMEYVEFGFTTFLCFCSFVVNALLILFFISKKTLRTAQHMYTVSIMLSSIILVPFALLIGTTRLSADGWMFGMFACQTTLYIIVTTAFIKIWLMTLISVDRYLRVVHANNRYLNKKLSVVLMLIAWIMPSATLAGMVYPHSETKYIPDIGDGITICTVAFEWHPSIRNALLYFSTIFMVEFFLPTTIMIVCYVLIMKRIRQSRAKLLKHSQASTKQSLSTRSTEKSLKSNIRRRRTTIILITIVTLFLIMWLPLFALLAVITLDQMLQTFHLSSNWVVGQVCVLLLNTLAEPFLYSFTTVKVRKELRRTLRSLRPTKVAIVSSTSFVDDTSTQINTSDS